jgi:hypothetical protein
VSFDQGKFISFLDKLYSVQANRSIWLSDAFDLLFRTQTNPETKDIPGLTALYRNHEEPLFSGYIRKFLPPNKIVVSEFTYNPPNLRNNTETITLLGLSADSNAKPVTEFMNALLNIKECKTLINEKESYKYYYTSDKAKQQAKQFAEYTFYPQLKVVIQYPQALDSQEEFFNGKNELSGVVLLEKGQSVCLKKEDKSVQDVKLGQLMLEGAKDQNEFSADYLEVRSTADDFINLNQYPTANALRTIVRDEDDPRPAAQFFGLFFNADPTSDGVKKILTVGAAE